MGERKDDPKSAMASAIALGATGPHVTRSTSDGKMGGIPAP